MAHNSSGTKPLHLGSPVRLDRLSRIIEDELGLDLDHDALKRLGYRAERKPNNPNTYYLVPGAHKAIENAPKALAYIKEHSGTKEGAMMLLGTTKVVKANRRVSAPAAVPKKRPAAVLSGASDAKTNVHADQSSQDAAGTRGVSAERVQARHQSQGLPAGFTPTSTSRQTKILDSLAHLMRLQCNNKNITVASLCDAGVMVLEDDRPIGPGERMKHAWVWWPGKMTEPLRCAQYVHCAKGLMDIKECKEALDNIEAAPDTAAAALAAVMPSEHAAAARHKRHSDVLPITGGGAAAAAIAAAVRRTRHGASDAVSTRASEAVPPPVSAVKTAAVPPAPAMAAPKSAGQGQQQQLENGAAAQPSKVPTASNVGAAGLQPPQGQQAQELPAGKRRRLSGHTTPAAGGIGAVVAARDANKHVEAAVLENQKVMQHIDEVVKQLGEALQLARSFTPAVLSSMPAVFTAGVAGPLESFLLEGANWNQTLSEDTTMCHSIAGEYAADQLYRRTYLAFRDALHSEAAAASAWLHGSQQQEMLEKLRVLTEFKQRWEEQRQQEEQLRKKERELQLAMEQLQREKELIAKQREQHKLAESQQHASHQQQPKESAVGGVQNGLGGDAAAVSAAADGSRTKE